MNKIHPLDWKFVKPDPDPDFNPEHNKRVIEDSIKKMDATIRKKEREGVEGYKERTSAIAQYLESVKKGNSSSIEKYFGKKYSAHLKGKETISRIQDELRVLGKDGRVIRERGQG